MNIAGIVVLKVFDGGIKNRRASQAASPNLKSVEKRAPPSSFCWPWPSSDAAQTLFHADHNAGKPLRMCIDN